MSQEFTFNAKQVKKMDNPMSGYEKKGSKKYVCYVKLQDVPDGFTDWMDTNPREQNLNTNVAREIKKSIEEGKKNFHEINRGIVMSVRNFSYDNQTGQITVVLDDRDIHGNIDGGHTLRIIVDKKQKNELLFEQYVFFEFFTGIKTPVDLAEARNLSVQVDQRSIEELNKSFECFKNALSDEEFYNRIAFKQNEHSGEKNVLDIKEIVAITNMFNQSMYPIKGESQPIQSYTGKVASLNRFLNQGQELREKLVADMSPVIPDIFKLWDLIETTFADRGNSAGRKYRRKKYSRYEKESTIVSYSMFSNTPLDYFLPKGLLYPLVGAFRALIKVDESSLKYSWEISPDDAWEALSGRLINIIMTSSEDLSDNPDAVGKSPNTWNLLFKEVLIYKMLHE